MTKKEAIAYLESLGWQVTNKRKVVVNITKGDRHYIVTTPELVAFAIRERDDQQFQANHEQYKREQQLPVLERDTQAIAEAIEKACRAIVMIAVACYVAGYTLGTWVHTANAWLVALHKRTCRDRLAIVAGYIVDGILSTKEQLRGVWA